MNRIIKPKTLNAGDKKSNNEEEEIVDVKFNIFKHNPRIKPDNIKDIVIISCLSEFGCEILGCMYCLPRLLQENAGKYTIVVGWYGRDYLYRHLVDEFWEVQDEFMHLRDYCRAFHHASKNLARLEKALNRFGKAIPSKELGRIAVGNKCHACGAFWGGLDNVTECKHCKSKDFTPAIFGNVKLWKPKARLILRPSQYKLDEACKYLGENPVGIFARGRKTYGRNLQSGFYVELIKMLRKRGYDPIWLGEKQSTLPCPVDNVIDFSRMPESRDLELTLAIMCHLKFTVQYWTASTRLATMMGTPYLLFESPDQIWGKGQEGYRRNLCDFGPSKLCICHYLNVYDNNKEGIKVTERCVEEMEQGNYEDVFDMLEEDMVAKEMKKNSQERIGGG